MADVFLSYKREDQRTAREIANDLEAEGYSVFFDVRIEVGDSWDAVIERELNAAKAVVVLWSPRSRDSQWVRREAREAMGRRILCPTMIANCKAPLEFSDVQAANLGSRRAGDRAHPEWRRLCEGVGRCVGRKAKGVVATPKPAPSTAPQITLPSLPRLDEIFSKPTVPPKPDRRAALIGGAAAGAALLAGGGYFAWTQTPAAIDQAWNIARSARTRRAVLNFLSSHPSATQARDARALLAELPLSIRQIASLHHPGTVHSAAFEKNGLRLVTACADRAARVWDSVSRRQITLLRGHQDVVFSASFSPNSARIVTASADGTVRLWDPATGFQMGRPRAYGTWVENAAFNPEGTNIVAAFGNEARIWNLSTDTDLASLPSESNMYDAAFSLDGSRVVTASEDHTARVWEASTGSQILALRGHAVAVVSAAFSADGMRIVSASYDRTACVWNAFTGAQIAQLRGHEDYVQHAEFSPDGLRIVTASGDKTARVWNAITGTQIAVLRGHDEAVRSAAFSPDGMRIVTASADGSARIWAIDEDA